MIKRGRKEKTINIEQIISSEIVYNEDASLLSFISTEPSTKEGDLTFTVKLYMAKTAVGKVHLIKQWQNIEHAQLVGILGNQTNTGSKRKSSRKIWFVSI